MSQINLPYGIELGNNTRQGAEKSALVTLYGDEGAVYAPWVFDAAMASHPREAALAPHHMIAVCGRWADPRPYGRVVETLEVAQRLLKGAGWQIASSVEGHLDTGTVIDDLRVVDEFPEEERAGGYNAACAFVFECEKPDQGFDYSDGEITALTALAQQVLDLL